MSRLLRLLSKPEISIVIRKIIELNFRKQKQIIRTHLLPLAASDRIIDIGCGTGEFSTQFPPSQYIGIDIDTANISYARRHFEAEFKAADAMRLPFDDGSFTHALVIGMLHHLDDGDAARALREMKRVVAARGRVLIMEDTASARPLTRALHRIDLGAHIRSADVWRQMVSQFFSIERHFTFYNSICHYSAFIATNNPL